MKTRSCERCSIGTETCVVGTFYTCSLCDADQLKTPDLGQDCFGLDDYESYVEDYMKYYRVYVTKVIDEKCYQFLNKMLPDDLICYPQPKFIEGGFRWESPQLHRIFGEVSKKTYFKDHDLLGKINLCEP